MTQSKLESFIEQVFNVGSGFVVAWCFWNFILIPMIDHGKISYQDTTAITFWFTIISVIRGYVWRRVFNKQWPHKFLEWVKIKL